MSDNKFPRAARLLQASEFKRVFARPQRSGDAYFTVLAAGSGDEAARLGLAISKKQVSRAIDRNRLKRLVRESFRHHRDELGGLNLVVMARRQATGVDNARLRKSLEQHWHRLTVENGRSRLDQTYTG